MTTIDYCCNGDRTVGTVPQVTVPKPEWAERNGDNVCLDACMVPAITALWAAGFFTLNCCCGHGGQFGDRPSIVMSQDPFDVEAARAVIAAVDDRPIELLQWQLVSLPSDDVRESVGDPSTRLLPVHFGPWAIEYVTPIKHADDCGCEAADGLTVEEVDPQCTEGQYCPALRYNDGQYCLAELRLDTLAVLIEDADTHEWDGVIKVEPIPQAGSPTHEHSGDPFNCPQGIGRPHFCPTCDEYGHKEPNAPTPSDQTSRNREWAEALVSSLATDEPDPAYAESILRKLNIDLYGSDTSRPIAEMDGRLYVTPDELAYLTDVLGVQEWQDEAVPPRDELAPASGTTTTEAHDG